MIQALRGMKDLIGENALRYEYCVEVCKRLAKNYGFNFIQTPTLEETRLFKRSVGESSDIVGKEMYQFIDKGGNDVCLRPEGTAGAVRAFIEAKLDRSLANHKFFYCESMYRYERPQKGRLRQFHQFGIESFGLNDPREDVNIILLGCEILNTLGIKYNLKINSIGCQECMPPFKKKLVKFLDNLDEFCEDCKRRKETNPLRVFDCKNDHCKNLLINAPRLHEDLCEECKNDFKKLQFYLDLCGVKYEIDTNIVRGLDYYSKTAFEFVSDELGSQGTLIGGGRYDRLVEFLEGKPTPGVGFGLGLERIAELAKMPENKKNGYYFGALDESSNDALLVLAKKFRSKEVVFYDYSIRTLGAHLKQADKKEALYFICVGKSDFDDGTIRVKNLQTKVEVAVKLDDFEVENDQLWA